MSSYPASIPRCQHLKINGTQCGSPALRRNHFCYFHKNWQETRIVLNANRARRARAILDLPVLEDANSVQVSLMQVMRLILSGQLDSKTAGLLLYALQTASSNLSRINFEPTVKTRVVIDPRTVDQTPLGEDPWSREDFEEEEYEEEDQDEAVQAAAPGDVDQEAITEEQIPQIQAVAESSEEAAKRRKNAAHGVSRGEKWGTDKPQRGERLALTHTPPAMRQLPNQGKTDATVVSLSGVATLAANLDQQVSRPIQPKALAGGHNRGRAIFRHNGRTRVLSSGLKGIPIANCGPDFLPSKKNRSALPIKAALGSSRAV
jgi:hypothetical protein